MRRNAPAIAAALVLCLLVPLGFLYISRAPASEAKPLRAPVIPPSIFDGMEVCTNGLWYLMADGRLADLSDGRVYATNLDFAPFERIETDGDRFLSDGKPFEVYRTKVYPALGALNGEYEALKVRFPDAVITAVSTIHLAAVSNECLYTFTDGGSMTVHRVDWELIGGMSVFEQVCLLYELSGESDAYYIYDGGVLRCFNTTFGELDIF